MQAFEFSTYTSLQNVLRAQKLGIFGKQGFKDFISLPACLAIFVERSGCCLSGN